MDKTDWELIEQRLARLSDKKQKIVWLLAEGYGQQQIADKLDISQPYISRLVNKSVDFREVLDALTFYLGLASRAERLRLAKRAMRQKELPDGQLKTDKDLLDWAKYIDKLLGEDRLRVEVEQVRFEQAKSMEELMRDLSDKDINGYIKRGEL